MTEHAKPGHLHKCKIMFIAQQLKKLNLEIMETFVKKQVDETEFHVKSYLARQALWIHLNDVGIGNLLKHFQKLFCELLLKCTKGGDHCARLLAAW